MSIVQTASFASLCNIAQRELGLSAIGLQELAASSGCSLIHRLWSCHRAVILCGLHRDISQPNDVPANARASNASPPSGPALSSPLPSDAFAPALAPIATRENKVPDNAAVKVALRLARHLQASGCQTHVALLRLNTAPTLPNTRPLSRLAELAAEFDVAYSDVAFTDVREPREIADLLAHHDLVIDALGFPAESPAASLFCDTVRQVSLSQKTVLSLVAPGGVDPVTGQTREPCVHADATLAFGFPQPGLFLAPGAFTRGQLYLARLGLPPHRLDRDSHHARGVRDVCTVRGAQPDHESSAPAPLVPQLTLARPVALAARPPDGHKGTFGTVLVIAGSANYLGAPFFATMASLRCGIGYAKLACPQSLVAPLSSLVPEAVLLGQPETAHQTLASASLEPLLRACVGARCVVIGPGLSTHEQTADVIRRLIPHVEAPLLIDGDALTALAGALPLIEQRQAPTMLTPHPGEMARLCHTTASDVCSRPTHYAAELASRLRAHVVLKVAPALSAAPDASVSVNTSGNSAMATAGSGDVLAGTVAAMVCLGLAPGDACVTGVFLHGLAGDLARDALGADSVTARDILHHLAPSLRQYRTHYHELTRHHHGACITFA